MSQAIRVTPGVLAALVPIVWVPVSIDSFILPRTTLTLTGAGLVMGLGLLAGHRSLGALRWPALAVLGAAILAAATSVVPTLSLAGDYGRYESLPVRLAYLGLFCSVVWLGERQRVVTGFLLGSGIAALEAAYQALSGGLARPDGNLGQANLLGALLAMAVPLAVERGRRDWRWLPLAALLGLGLAVSASRSGWLGAAVGLAVSVLWWTPGRWRPLIAAVGAVALLGGAEGILLTPLRSLNHDTGMARLGVWGDALHLIASRPLTGWGEDATGLVLGRFQSADWEPGSRFDRVHSMPLDLLVTQGLLGLVACAWLFGVLWRRLWGRPEVGGLAGALAAYLAWSLLNFDWAPATAPLWLLAGCAWAEDERPPAVEARRAFPGWPRAGLALSVCLLGLAAALPAQAADMAAYWGRNDLAVSLAPLQPRYWAALGGLGPLRRSVALGSTDPDTAIALGDAEAAAGHGGAARAAYERALAIYPYYVRARQRMAESSSW